jgi:protein-L-isoaspartate(D-aspartate) O-methyltransferase
VRRDGWIERQLRARGIDDERVLAAMGRVPRERFVPERLRWLAYEDEALPIGAGQTVSQPYIVAYICQALALDGDERVLDVGAGSGYQAAVLAELADEVHSIERIPELAERARATLAEAGYGRVEIHVGDGTLGLPEHAPYDGIAVAAATRELPPALWEQLRDGARIVLPLGRRQVQELHAIERTPAGPRVLASLPVRFVPLVSEGPGRARAEVRVTGRVQGIGFRYLAERRARSLGVSGWIRNEPGGAVAAAFEGPRDRVESMIDWCRRGPSGSRVDEVEVSWRAPQGEESFTIG